MSRIEIHELDETSASREASNVNVVFVPGFTFGVPPINKHAIIFKKDIGTASYTPTSGTAVGDIGYFISSSTEKAYKWDTAGGASQPSWVAITDATEKKNTILAIKSYNETSKDDFIKLYENEEDFIKDLGEEPSVYNEDTTYASLGFSSNAYFDSTSTICKEGEPEIAYLYARELLHSGLPVLFACKSSVTSTEKDNGDIEFSATINSVQNLYNWLIGSTGNESILDSISEKGSYDIKYLTTGGYPVFEHGTGSTANKLAKKLIAVAKSRGDCVALIDHTDYVERSLVATDGIHTSESALPTNPSVYDVVNGAHVSPENAYAITGDDAKYASMFTPWALTRFQTYGGIVSMPASFSYLKCVAKAIQTNADWLAMAGVARGIVPDLVQLNTSKVLSNTLADKYQPRDAVAINPVTYIRNYGYTIWGNRTLFDNAKAGDLTASSFLNTRNMVSNIKKIILSACQSLMFEPNNDILWINFQSLITPTLDQMVTGYGLDKYKILQGKYNPVTGKLEQPKDKAKLYATIKLWPVYAVESFDVTVVITDQDVEVETNA